MTDEQTAANARSAGFALPGVLRIAADDALGLLEQMADVGFDPIMLTEVCGFHAPALAAALAARRPGIRLGTSILPLGARTGPTMAMAATTIAQLSGAPFLLGVGTSSPQIVGDWHGQEHDPGLDTTRARLTELRAVLDGQRRGSFRLPLPAGADVRVLLGALGPNMTALALEAADGVILNHTPPGDVGPAPVDTDVLAFVWTPAAPDGDARVRRELISYMMAEPYARHYRRLGFGDVVDRVHALHADGRLRDAPTVVPGDMVDTLYVDPDALAARCAAYRQAGALPVIVPVTGDDPAADIARLVAARRWEQ
ncbi:MAG: LLM class flavin-dependent oxidoreductase [Actinobacteria bacterium]|nr:LLM class flavin-dependent oxidoreductase [Actinomycetota bacterium]